MTEAIKENLEKSLDELVYAKNHLNSARETAVKKHVKEEISDVLEKVETSIESAQNSIDDFKV